MNNKQFISKTFAILFLFFSLLPNAYALSLQEAKEQGLIGEQRNGYLGLVVSSVPQDVEAMVRDVNSQRRQEYQRIAAANNINLDQVAALAYERAIKATKSGHFLQNASGAWVKK